MLMIVSLEVRAYICVFCVLFYYVLEFLKCTELHNRGSILHSCDANWIL